MFCSSPCWSCTNIYSVIRYCVANHFLCPCVYDRVCMNHESAINYYDYIIILDMHII